MEKRNYEVKSRNTNGTWSTREFKIFGSHNQAENYADNLTAKTGFKHKVEFQGIVEDLSEEDTTEEQTTDSTSEDENESSSGDELTNVTLSDPEDRLDLDWADDYDEEEFPKGWWLQSRFVAKDGTVFDKKEEKPELYRTLEPSEY